jgi:APA family basic amino acid/polyamine antiporter
VATFEKNPIHSVRMEPAAASIRRSDAPERLRRILDLKDLVSMIIGTVIGSGIFLVPGSVLRALGNSVPWALAVWFAGGILSLLGALTYGELSAMKPRAGGLYIFIRDCFGPFPAFLFGWTLFFVISSGSIATLAVALSSYLGEFVPLSAWNMKLVAVLMILVITAVNMRGTRESADLLNVTTAIKVIAILVMSFVLLWHGRHPILGDAAPAAQPVTRLAGFGLAMISVLWAYEGWQYATYTAGETIDPQRTFPLAFLIGTVVLTGIYLFANLGYIAALGVSGVASSSRVAAAALETVVNRRTGELVTIAILISIFSAANSIMLNAPRVYYAMARDRLFFRSLSEIHPRFGTPAFAIAAAGIWSSVLAVSGTFEQLLTYVVFVGWIFYALAACSVFVYRRRAPAAARPYRVPGYPFTPIVFIAVAMALVGNTIATRPAQAGAGLGIVLLGAPAYLFWRRNAHSADREEAEHG